MNVHKMPSIKARLREEFESRDTSEAETLISKPRKGKSPRVKVNARRSHSAPGTQFTRKLYLSSVKSGNTGVSKKAATVSGLKRSGESGWSFLSTSNYMRQLVIGGTKDGLSDSHRSGQSDRSGGQMSASPAYKSREEYYDEIIDLKKTIQASNQEMSKVKAKLRRIEEDNLKKEREIEQLLDPKKNPDLRRTLTERNVDSAATVIDGLKKKILKLEIQLREKEATNQKLLADMKFTKTEEMKTQIDVLFREIVRLQNVKSGDDLDQTDRTRSLSKENGSKIKALNETVLRLNDANQSLQQENNKLREDAQRVADEGPPLEPSELRNLQTSSKNDLISLVKRLKRQVVRAERFQDGDSLSLSSADVRPSENTSKIVLDGTLEQRLDQLDKRETDLLRENEKCRSLIKRLKEDRNFYQKTVEEKEIEIKTLKKYLDDIPPSSSLSSGKVRRPPTAHRDSTTTKPSHKDVTPRKLSSRPSSASSPATRSQRSPVEDERRRELDTFRQSRAAKRIQKEWRQHRGEVEKDDAMAVIQAALRSHQERRMQLDRWKRRGSSEERSDGDNATSSTVGGHAARKRVVDDFWDN